MSLHICTVPVLWSACMKPDFMTKAKGKADLMCS